MKMLSFIHQKGCKGIVAMKKMTEIKGHGMMELFKPYCISVRSFQLTFLYLIEIL